VSIPIASPTFPSNLITHNFLPGIAHGECGIYQDFITAGKPVFQIEYPLGAPGFVSTQALKQSCKINGNVGFSEVIKGKELGGWVEYCDGTVFNTPTYT